MCSFSHSSISCVGVTLRSMDTCYKYPGTNFVCVLAVSNTIFILFSGLNKKTQKRAGRDSINREF